MIRLIRPVAKRAIGVLFEEVLYSHVYVHVPARQAARPDLDIRQDKRPDGQIHFAAYDGDRLLCECCFIDGGSYYGRFPWALDRCDAVLVRLRTDPAVRGRGLAPKLIAHASAAMTAQGHARLFAMIWHSNKPSKNAFRKAGWILTARHLTLRRHGRSIDFVWPRPPKLDAASGAGAP